MGAMDRNTYIMLRTCGQYLRYADPEELAGAHPRRVVDLMAGDLFFIEDRMRGAVLAEVVDVVDERRYGQPGFLVYFETEDHFTARWFRYWENFAVISPDC